MSSNRDAYEQGNRFYNAGDVEGLVNLYDEDATLVRPSGTFEGRAAIRDAWSRDKAALPDGTVTPDVIVEQGDTICGRVDPCRYAHGSARHAGRH
jgi:ketosteroid isomerase-like protein